MVCRQVKWLNGKSNDATFYFCYEKCGQRGEGESAERPASQGVSRDSLLQPTGGPQRAAKTAQCFTATTNSAASRQNWCACPKAPVSKRHGGLPVGGRWEDFTALWGLKEQCAWNETSVWGPAMRKRIVAVFAPFRQLPTSPWQCSFMLHIFSRFLTPPPPFYNRALLK